MENTFCHILAELRKARGLSQRHAAADLQISQALLSHYENGAREPGLPFVCRACDYYGVSADYLLGRESRADAGRATDSQLKSIAAQLRELADIAESYTK
mgnify:CR=1 FL=1